MSAKSVSNHLNLNLVKMSALSVEVLVEDKKHAETAEFRVKKGLADEIHRKERAKDSYRCYLAYMELRERERWES